MKLTKKLLLLVIVSALMVSAFAGCARKDVATDLGTMTGEEVEAFEKMAGGTSGKFAYGSESDQKKNTL